MRLIDVDALESHGIYNGVEYKDVVYLDDIKKMPTVSKYKKILRSDGIGIVVVIILTGMNQRWW